MNDLFRPLCRAVQVVGILGFSAASLFAAPLIPSYSDHWSDSYEVAWPNGTLVPLYDQADLEAVKEADRGHLSALVRRIPKEEFDSSIVPSATEAVRLMRRAMEAYPQASLLAQIPLTRQAAKPPPAPAGTQHVWIVDMAVRTGDLSREWYVTGVSVGSSELLVPLANAREKLRDRWPRLFSREAYPWDDRRKAIGDWKPDPKAVTVSRFLSPHLHDFRDTWEPKSTTWYPRAYGFTDDAGKPNEELLAQLFDEADAYFGESDFGIANFKVTDAGGQLMGDGSLLNADQLAHLRAQIQTSPAKYLAYEQPPHTYLGGEMVLYRQLVVAGPHGDLHVLPGGLTQSTSGRRFLTLVVSDPYPESQIVKYSAEPAQLATVCRLAGQLDPKIYMDKIGQLDGEVVADPRWAKAPGVHFTNRTTRVPNTQLDQVAEYLQNYYRSLGFHPRTQPCVYHGHTYHNVIVDIPGQEPDWVLFADHYDAAPAYDTWRGPSPEHPARAAHSAESAAAPVHPILTTGFKWTRPHHSARRKHIFAQETANHDDVDELPAKLPYTPDGLKAAPGADDNATASAALMEAGRIWSEHAHGIKPRHGIRLVHLFGEEFPAESFGARVYVAQALAAGEKIRGLVLMDMIGNAGPAGHFNDGLFQISGGENPRSGILSGAALAAFAALKEQSLVPEKLSPHTRGRFDGLSFLFQTDGIIFSDVGYPVVVFNEHMNKKHHLFRPGYHDRKDNLAWIAVPYAAGVARVALATMLLLAL